MSEKDSNTNNNYTRILKSNALFGGLQVYLILVQIIRSKIIAVLLGPAGLGVLGLFTSATKLISDVSSLGISQSAIRDVSEAFGSGNIQKVSRTIKIVRRLIWVTGLIGTAVVIFLSPMLSKTSFGNSDYTIPFIFLSVTLLLDQLCAGQKVLLQGTRKLKNLAKASAIGSTLGLIVSVPLYYLFGVKGIVPTLILYSLISLMLTWYYSRQIKVERVEITYKETFKEGLSMLKFGIALCFSGILLSASTYILRSYISSIGGTVDVGLYVAGFAIVNSYVGMIFTAISTDYYPRMSAVNKDNCKCRQMVNEQGEIAVLLMAPLLLFCIVFMPNFIKLLYSNDFSGANDYIMWAVSGMLFKLASWIVGFMFVAKAESKVFLINEITVALYGMLFSVIGYKLLGMTGLGIAFLLKFIVYSIQTYLIAYFRYNFSFTKSFLSLFGVQLFLLCLCLVFVVSLNSQLIMYIIGMVIILLSSFYSLRGLNQRVDIVTILKNKIK